MPREPVIAVHGTFAQDAVWWRARGQFCVALDRELERRGSPASLLGLDEDIPEFRLEGSNSEIARGAAAESLPDYITAVQRPKDMHRRASKWVAGQTNPRHKLIRRRC